MHNAAIEALGLDAAYLPFAVPSERLPQAIEGLRALGIRGVNVTLPHKQAILPLLDAVEDDARAIGAVNTVIHEGDRLIGANTDAAGLARSLRDAGVPLQDANVLVVGAGGAARAAGVGLGKAGAARIVVAARRVEQARNLTRELRDACGGASLHAVSLGDELAHEMPRADLLVQASSATLDDGPAAHTLAERLPLDALASSAVVTDLVYRPLHTAVMRRAETLGLKTVDGLGMLLHQGALAFERFTGQAPPIDVMRRALNER